SLPVRGDRAPSTTGRGGTPCTSWPATVAVLPRRGRAGRRPGHGRRAAMISDYDVIVIGGGCPASTASVSWPTVASGSPSWSENSSAASARTSLAYRPRRCCGSGEAVHDAREDRKSVV